MLVIGLTGGIGSGKSVVADLFAERDIPIIDADMIAREVTQSGSPALADIAEHFGSSVIQEDGTLNRTALRDKIFADADERIWLENLLHPLILQRIDEIIRSLKTPYCIVVIPLLFETGTQTLIDRTLLVDAPETEQVARVSRRDHVSIEHVQAIMQTQTTREQRRALADDVIVNDGSLADLEAQVDTLHEKYSKAANAKSSAG